MIKVNCKNCNGETEKSAGRYNEAIKNGWNFFCSIKCRYAFQEKGKNVSCAWCSQIIRKTPGQIRQTKTNVFCTKSCAALFNNRHKEYGTRRSKLEIHLEQQLKANFPDLDFLTNSNKTIGLELDFYFPQLNLAIEINGFLHYRPIYGAEKLKRVQELDKEKAMRCRRKNIRIFVIDVSNEPHLTQSIKEKHWSTVEKLIMSSDKYLESSSNKAKQQTTIS